MKVRHIILKDLKLIFSDKKALAILILMPLVLSSILGFALAGSFGGNYSTEKINILVVKKYDLDKEVNEVKEFLKNNPIMKNSDTNENSIENHINSIDVEKLFTEEFLNNEGIKEIIKYDFSDEENAKEQLNEKNISAIVVLPENFIYDMYINYLTGFTNKIDIEIIGHPDRTISSQIVEGIIKGFADISSSMIIQKNVFIESLIENNIEIKNLNTIMSEMSSNANTLPINIEYEKVDGKEPITGTQYYSIAMTTMFILFVAGYGSKLLLDEKFDKTYQRMVISGLSKWKLLSGKFLVIFILGLVQVLVMIIYSSNMLKSSWGNPLHTGIISIFAVFAVSGLGIMLASISFISENYKVADLTQSVIFQIMALLGGSFIPIEVMPDFVKKLSNFTLNGLALKAYTKITVGYGFKEVIPFLTPLFIMGIIFIPISILILKRQERGKVDVKYN